MPTKKNDAPKKRGRKPSKATEAPAVAVDNEALAELSLTEGEINTMQAAYSEERDLVNQLLGQAQAFSAASDFLRLSGISKLAYVRETKAYKAIAGMKDSDGRTLTGTFDEFCSLIGMSASKVHEDIQNLRTFGEETLESLTRMGIGIRELRQYRRLPEDGQQALSEVAKSGDKEALLDLAEELIAKQKKEKDEMAKALDEAKADVAAKDAVIAKKSEKIDSLETQAQKIKALPADEQSMQIRADADLLCFDVEARIRGQLLEALEAVKTHADDHQINIDSWLEGQLDQIDDALLTVRDMLCMPRTV